jgi:hypothetical protein
MSLSLQTKIATNGCLAEGILLRRKPTLNTKESLILGEDLEDLYCLKGKNRILDQFKI